MSVAAGCVGIAQAALDVAVRYATEREQFGKTIAHHQLVQELISDIAVDVDAARLLTWRVADLVDRGLPFATESSKAKLFASEPDGARREQRTPGLRRLRLHRRVPGGQAAARRPA